VTGMHAAAGRICRDFTPEKTKQKPYLIKRILRVSACLPPPTIQISLQTHCPRRVAPSMRPHLPAKGRCSVSPPRGLGKVHCKTRTKRHVRASCPRAGSHHGAEALARQHKCCCSHKQNRNRHTRVAMRPISNHVFSSRLRVRGIEQQYTILRIFETRFRG
jgi:hypothetical protein